MKKNLWILFTVLVVTLFAVAACGPAAQPTEETGAEPVEVVEEPTAVPEPTEVMEEPTAVPEPTEAMEEPTEEPAVASLTIWADETRAPVIEELGQQFTDEFGVEIVVQQVGFGDIRDNFSVAGPAGEGPDIIIGAHDWLGELVASGLLAPIDLGELESDFSPAAIEGFTYEGTLYGLPYATENVALIYNPDLVPEPPTTWDEVKTISQQLVSDGVATYGYILQPNDAYHFFPIQTAFGGYVFGLGPDGYDASDVGIDSEGTLAAAEWLDGMVKDGLLSPDVDWDTMHALFEQGEAAMLITGPWAIGRFQEAGVNYAITNLPSETQESQPFLGVQGFMISAFSEDPLLAQIFLTEFVATEDAMRMIYEAGDRPSAHLGVLAGLDDPDLLAFGQAGANGLPMPAIPAMSAVWGSWGDAITLVFQQQYDADFTTATDFFTSAAEQIRTTIAEGQ